MLREQLTRYLDDLLEAARYRDYCPNGLQVEGRPDVVRIVAGVTASQALIDAAIAAGADTLLVHHGWFWRGEEIRVTGTRRSRLRALLQNDINLIAYHLPLDAHAELGNNAQLARRLDWSVDYRFGEQGLGCVGHLAQAMNLIEFAATIEGRLDRAPLVIGAGERPIRRVAWATGAAQSLFEEAIDEGADVFVSGEISEKIVHLARESGVAYIAAGHHATERYGVQALAEHLAGHFQLDCRFVDIASPV